MKLNLLLLCITWLTFNYLGAQSEVRFERFLRPYKAVTDSTSLNEGELWDDPDYEVLSDFRNDFFNSDTSLYLYGLSGGGVLFLSTVMDEFNLIAPTNFDLVDRGYDDFETSESELSWTIEGVDDNRQMVFEWKNAGFFAEVDVDDSLESFVNFQVRIFEDEPVIEVHYGPSFIKYDFSFYSEIEDIFMACGVGKSNEEQDILKTWLLNGDPENPELKYLEFTDVPEDESFVGLIGWPVENTVYRFYVPSVNIKNIWSKVHSYNIQPNPASDLIKVSLDSDIIDSDFNIKNVNGIVMKKRGPNG